MITWNRANTKKFFQKIMYILFILFIWQKVGVREAKLTLIS